MKYKVGDKVRIKSREWYEQNKGEDGCVSTPRVFISGMSRYCGATAVVKHVDDNGYQLDIDDGLLSWDDMMLEDGPQQSEASGTPEEVARKIANIAVDEIMKRIQFPQPERKEIDWEERQWQAVLAAINAGCGVVTAWYDGKEEKCIDNKLVIQQASNLIEEYKKNYHESKNQING